MCDISFSSPSGAEWQTHLEKPVDSRRRLEFDGDAKDMLHTFEGISDISSHDPRDLLGVCSRVVLAENQIS